MHESMAGLRASSDRSEVDDVFRELAVQHQERLYRFVLKRIGQTTEAEEISQQAMFEAYRAYGSFKGQSRVSTWLYGIALNLVRNHLSRSPGRTYRFEQEEVLEGAACDGAEPRQQLEMKQLVAMLSVEIDNLTPAMREVLLLIALDDVSYEEAAVRLSMPVGTVRSRLSRARAHLRKRFAQAGVPLPY